VNIVHVTVQVLDLALWQRSGGPAATRRFRRNMRQLGYDVFIMVEEVAPQPPDMTA
jgi:hypothetical protein